MTTMTMPSNGSRAVRRSLAGEIDRLDQMLDGLSEGLNAAVADAVKQAVGTAVREAVQTALAEVLASPAMAARLAAAAPPAPAPAVERAAPPANVTEGWRSRLRRWVDKARRVVAGAARAAGERLHELWAWRGLVRRFRYQLLAALTAGLLLGAVAWYAHPWLGSAVSAASGFAVTLAAQAALWLRGTLSPEPQPADGPAREGSRWPRY